MMPRRGEPCQYCGFEIKSGKLVYVNEEEAHYECALLAGDIEEGDELEEDFDDDDN